MAFLVTGASFRVRSSVASGSPIRFIGCGAFLSSQLDPSFFPPRAPFSAFSRVAPCHFICEQRSASLPWVASENTWIEFNPGVFDGKPCIRGTDISVEFLLELLAGMTPDTLLATYPQVTKEGLDAALRYAANAMKAIATIGDQYCNDCAQFTRHHVLFSTTITKSAERPDGEVHDSIAYTLHKCGGCEHVTLIRDCYGDSTHGESDIAYFPPRVLRKKPEWLRQFRFAWDSFNGHPVFALLDEIYTALDNDATRLVALGIRSLIEHVMVERSGDNGTFHENLTEFAKGHASELQRKQLNHVIELGHAVTHRAHKPTLQQVYAALNVVETVMRSIYNDSVEIEMHVTDLPPRTARGGKPKT